MPANHHDVPARQNCPDWSHGRNIGGLSVAANKGLHPKRSAGNDEQINVEPIFFKDAGALRNVKR